LIPFETLVAYGVRTRPRGGWPDSADAAASALALDILESVRNFLTTKSGPPWKARMTPILLQLLRAWRPLGRQVARWFRPGEPVPQDHPFAPTDLAQLLRVSGADRSGDRSAELDDATWRDLLLARYLDTLGVDASIFGRQVLYRRLRAGAGPGAGSGADEPNVSSLSVQRARVTRLLQEPAQLDALHARLACLRAADIEGATLLMQDEPPLRPGWVSHLLWLPLLLAASIVAALLVSPWGWVGAGVAMVFLIRTRMRYQDSIGPWKRSLRALQMLLRACSLLDGSGLMLTEAFAGRADIGGRLNRALSRSLVAKTIPDAAEYANWFLAAEVRHYFQTVGLVFGQRAFLRECFWLCAELEADVALARHLRTRTREGAAWCWADSSGQRTL
jgi:hypothetical protein